MKPSSSGDRNCHQTDHTLHCSPEPLGFFRRYDNMQSAGGRREHDSEEYQVRAPAMGESSENRGPCHSGRFLHKVVA